MFGEDALESAHLVDHGELRLGVVKLELNITKSVLSAPLSKVVRGKESLGSREMVGPERGMTGKAGDV